MQHTRHQPPLLQLDSHVVEDSVDGEFGGEVGVRAAGGAVGDGADARKHYCDVRWGCGGGQDIGEEAPEVVGCEGVLEGGEADGGEGVGGVWGHDACLVSTSTSIGDFELLTDGRCLTGHPPVQRQETS